MPISTEADSKSHNMCPWSDEISDDLLYEGAAQFFDEEWGDKMDTSEPPATFTSAPIMQAYYKNC